MAFAAGNREGPALSDWRYYARGNASVCGVCCRLANRASLPPLR